MAQFQQGDMWMAYKRADLFLITTNETLKRNGALVMGRGIARQARDRFPGLDLTFGREIARRCGNRGEYELLVSPRWAAAKLGAFQVKTDYGWPALPALIRQSAIALLSWCEAHPGAAVHLNFPGIGNGGLARGQVLPMLKSLPANVHVWEYGRAPPLREMNHGSTERTDRGPTHHSGWRAALSLLPGRHGRCDGIFVSRRRQDRNRRG